MSDDRTTPEPATDEAALADQAPVIDETALSDETPVSSEPAATVEPDATPTSDEAPAPTATATAEAPHYGVGPFSIREVALLGVWVVAFIVSFFSVWVESSISAVVLPFGSVWSTGIDWILTIGVPTVAVFLVVLRRFSPDGIRRVGSLAIDQFASVAFSVSAVVWLGLLWTNIARAIQTGLWLSSWVVWVEFFLMLAGVFLTVLAPFIAPFDEDFRHRAEVPAHRNARPVRPVTARPAGLRPVATAGLDQGAAAPGFGTGYGSDGYDAQGYGAQGYGADSASVFDEPSPFAPQEEAQPVADSAPAASQAFWALAPVERDVVDENGLPLFTIGPTAWALVIEDRGDSFVVRHEDGRVGYLTDVSGVTRG